MAWGSSPWGFFAWSGDGLDLALPIDLTFVTVVYTPTVVVPPVAFKPRIISQGTP